MKINHAGEISAQYLYYGQSFLIKENYSKYFLLKSGQEEKKHLFWCLYYLNLYRKKQSKLRLLWKNGSFLIGTVPSFFNFKYNLGFLVETEYQVSKHLSSQIESLSKSDYSLYFILNKMLDDEVKHANNAIILESFVLPELSKNVMKFVSFFMVNTASYI